MHKTSYLPKRLSPCLIVSQAFSKENKLFQKSQEVSTVTLNGNLVLSYFFNVLFGNTVIPNTEKLQKQYKEYPQIPLPFPQIYLLYFVPICFKFAVLSVSICPSTYLSQNIFWGAALIAFSPQQEPVTVHFMVIFCLF